MITFEPKTTGPIIEDSFKQESKIVVGWTTEDGRLGDIYGIFDTMDAADMDVRRTLTHTVNDDYEATGIKLVSITSLTTEHRSVLKYFGVLQDEKHGTGFKSECLGEFCFRTTDHMVATYIELAQGEMRPSVSDDADVSTVS